MVLIKKEFLESLRKYKLLVMIVVFLLIGIMSPVGTKYLGEILTQLLPEGYVLEVREASEVEAYFQFFKNISQIGLIVLIFVTSSLMADELDKKTIVNVLTKGINRSAIIASKFAASSVIWIFSYFVSFVIFWYYTDVFWGNEVDFFVVLYSNLIILVYGFLILGINILLGVIFQNRILTVVVCVILNLIQMFAAFFPQISKVLPISLLSHCVYLVEGKIKISDTIITLIVTLLCTILFLWLSISLFKRKEIEQ